MRFAYSTVQAFLRDNDTPQATIHRGALSNFGFLLNNKEVLFLHCSISKMKLPSARKRRTNGYLCWAVILLMRRHQTATTAVWGADATSPLDALQDSSSLLLLADSFDKGVSSFDLFEPLNNKDELSSSSFPFRDPDDRLDPNYWIDLPSNEHHQGSSNSNNPYSKHKPSRYLSTGTTIVGIAVGDTCILAADTRATAGSLVADRRADKLHPLGKYAAAAGAGTSADLDHITRQCLYVGKLRSRLAKSVGNVDTDTDILEDDFWDSDETETSVLRLVDYLRDRLYEQGGSCEANLIVGGIDPKTGKAHLRAIHPHGSVDILEFTALGSGGLAAMAVLESGYPKLLTATNSNKNSTVEGAIALAIEAVRAGIRHDLGSGSQVDLVIITRDGCKYMRSVFPEETLPSHNVTSSITETPGSPPPGVNGFGSMPFSVRATRVVRISQQEEEKQNLENWNDILQLQDK